MSAYDKLTEDPCRAKSTYSPSRAAVFVLLFIAMFGFEFFAMLSESLVGTLVGSMMGYTAFVMLYGFSHNRNGIQPFLFTCPVVVSQYPRLLKRHAVFLALVVVFVSSVTNFLVVLPIGALAVTEVITNRGVLEHAHKDLFGESPSPNDSERATLGILGPDQ
jgi:hypothetical protein